MNKKIPIVLPLSQLYTLQDINGFAQKKVAENESVAWAVNTDSTKSRKNSEKAVFKSHD